jgi:hypothetical protein
MRCAIDAPLRETLRLPPSTDDAAVGVAREAHACLGIRLLNGFVNNSSAAAAAWACLPECTLLTTAVPPTEVSHQYYFNRIKLTVTIFQVFIVSDSEDDDSDQLLGDIPPSALHRYVPIASTSRPQAISRNDSRPAATIRRSLQNSALPPSRQQQPSPVITILSLSDTPSPPPAPQIIQVSKFSPQVCSIWLLPTTWAHHFASAGCSRQRQKTSLSIPQQYPRIL